MKKALFIAAGLLAAASLFLLPVVGNAGLPTPPLPPLPPLLVPSPPSVVIIRDKHKDMHKDKHEGKRGRKHKKHEGEREDRHDREH